jgi:hypothetical protein
MRSAGSIAICLEAEQQGRTGAGRRLHVKPAEPDICVSLSVGEPDCVPEQLCLQPHGDVIGDLGPLPQTCSKRLHRFLVSP